MGVSKRLCVGIVAGLLVSGGTHLLHAQSGDPLWQQTQAYTAGLKNRVASRTITNLEVFDAKGKSEGRMVDVDLLSGWKGEKPIWKKESHQGEEEMELEDLDFLRIVQHPDKVLSTNEKSTITRHVDEVVEGVSCAVFHVQDAKPSRTRRFWIDKANGLPRKMDMSLSQTSIKSLYATVSFRRWANGDWLPASTQSDTVVSVLFKTMRMKTQMAFSDWALRPAKP